MVAEAQQDFRHLAAERAFADLWIGVLRQQQAGAFRKLQRPVQERRLPALHAKDPVERGAVVDDLEGVRIFFQRLFRLGQSRAVLFPATPSQPRDRRLQPVVLHFIAKQNVHRRVEKIRQLHEHSQLRLRQPRFPLVDRARCDAQHLGQLLLRQGACLPERADVLRKLIRHICSPFLFR